MPREQASQVIDTYYVERPLDRVDGVAKVTGTATYAAEFNVPNLAHAVAIYTRIPKGRLLRVDDAEARTVPGFIAVITLFNAPKLNPDAPPLVEYDEGDSSTVALTPNTFVLQTCEIAHYGQEVGVAVAETFEAARDIAARVRFEYLEEAAQVDLKQHLDQAQKPEQFMMSSGPDAERGDVEAGLEQAAEVVDATYELPALHHCTMEPNATLSSWENDQLTLYTSSQYVHGVRKLVANTFRIPYEKIRVVSPFVGGAFGSKAAAWTHVFLSVMASQVVGRPVKLVLSRHQTFTSHGHRPRHIQRVRLGATADGNLTAIDHEIYVQTSVEKEFVPPTGEVTPVLYQCPNVRYQHRAVATHTPIGTIQRAPGAAPGSLALESAMDELAYKLKLDPVELRLRNDPADKNPSTGLPWSSKSMATCFREGARRFGWERRSAEPRSMRNGRWLTGMGVATATYKARRAKSSARLTLSADGSLLVETGAADIGTGTYTVLAQIAADAVGVPVEQVTVSIGDTTLPWAPVSGGSTGIHSYGSGVLAAGESLRAEILSLVHQDSRSPFHHLDSSLLKVRDGKILATSDSDRTETVTELMRRNGRDQWVVLEQAEPDQQAMDNFAMQSFGAHFCEVRVDPDTGEVRVTRFQSTYGVGRLLNPKTARSQLMGGAVWGIGMALTEAGLMDSRSAHFVNDDLAEYHIPVHADIPAVEVHIIDEIESRMSRLGGKGVGEIGIVGSAAAVANAVYHATGVRVREFPITPEKLIASL